MHAIENGYGICGSQIKQLLTLIAVDISLSSGAVAARDALINSLTDTLKVYKNELAPGTVSSKQLMAPENMKLLPLYVLGIFKHVCVCSSQDRSSLLHSRLFVSTTCTPLTSALTQWCC